MLLYISFNLICFQPRGFCSQISAPAPRIEVEMQVNSTERAVAHVQISFLILFSAMQLFPILAYRFIYVCLSCFCSPDLQGMCSQRMCILQ